MRFVFLSLSVILSVGGLLGAAYLRFRSGLDLNQLQEMIFYAVPGCFVLGLLMYMLYVRTKYKDILGQEKKLKEETELISKERKELLTAKDEIEQIETLNSLGEKLNKIIQQSESHKMLAENLVQNLAKEIDACQGLFYIQEEIKGINRLRLFGSYAFNKTESEEIAFEFGEGLAGQVAQEGKMMSFDNIPEGYLQVLSGLGQSSPNNLCLFPLLYNEKVLGLIEIASFNEFSKGDMMLFERLQVTLGAALNLLNLQVEINRLKK